MIQIQPEPMHPMEAFIAALVAVGIAALVASVVVSLSWVWGKWRGRG